MTEETDVVDPNTGEVIDIDGIVLRAQRATLTGDIRDFLLNHLKDKKKALPWNLLPMAEQEEVIQLANNAAQTLVERIVRMVAADGRKTLSAQVEQFTVKDDMKAVVRLYASDQAVLAMNHARSVPVEIVLADDSAYQGEREPVYATEDQSDLDFTGDDPDEQPQPEAA